LRRCLDRGARHGHIAVRGHAAAVVDRAAVQAQLRAGGQLARVLEAAVGGDDQFTGSGADIAGIAHAHACFAADQENLVGIHAAQPADVDGVSWRALLSCLGSDVDRVACNRDFTGAGQHVQVLRPQRSVDCHRACDERRVVGAAGVQASAIDADLPARDRETVDAAVVEARAASGERGAADVDETTPIDCDAGRVGDDDFGALSRHFHKALQAARAGRIDFIEDDARLSLRQPWIGLHPATQLGLGVGT
jgi:hypothetical protein